MRQPSRRCGTRSGLGSVWDRLTYKLDERGLPVEKVWSRRECITQDPCGLTRCTCEFHP